MFRSTSHRLFRHARLISLTLCFLWLTALCNFGWCAEKASGVKAERPNVIVILTDDQGYGDLSCHGNPVIKTPNLDRLHSESARFTDFHVAPMCTPTRGELMTSVDALRNSAMNVSSGRTLLQRDLPTMANVFADAGYRTGIFGKWHLGDMYPYRPKDRGFEDSVCFRSSYIGSAADLFNNDYFNDKYLFDDKYQPVKGYCTDVFFNEAIRWIKDRKEKGESFFAYIPTNAPHGPLHVPERYRKEYEKALADKKMDKNYRKRLARYYGMIVNIDDNLGRLEKVLEETGLRDNTIIVYMSDNGGTAGVRFYNAGMKGHKVQLWEGGHRVPCFVRWPAGNIASGRDIDTLAECQDVLPTLIDLCDLKKPAGAKFDGSSLAGALKGEADQKLDDRILVVQFSRMPIHVNAVPEKNDAAVMWRKWRLLRGKELYDLSADPHQDKNVIKKYPEIAERLQKHYDQWWAEVEPTLNTFQPSVIGSDKQNPTRLCACEWANVFVDQMGQVRRGVKKNGLWHVEAEQPGKYRFSLRRWPSEVGDIPLAGSTPRHKGEDCNFAPGKALPIAKARLRVGGQEFEKEVTSDDCEAVFTATLPKGRTTVETWFYNKADKELCGAYYVYVERLEE